MKIIQYREIDRRAIYGTVDPFSTIGYRMLKDYCQANNWYFYARVADKFDLNEAVKLAKKYNKSAVLVEKLS